jgi:hypothetical protein
VTIGLAVRLAVLTIARGPAGLASAEGPSIENIDRTGVALGGSPLTTWQAELPVRFRLGASNVARGGGRGLQPLDGGYRFDGAHPSFTAAATTRTYCGERTMALESTALNALEATDRGRSQDGRAPGAVRGAAGAGRVSGRRGRCGGPAAPRFANRVWRAAAGRSIPPGRLYVFLSQSTPMIKSTHRRSAIDSRAHRDGPLTMTEARLTCRVKSLATAAAFSIEVAHPGQPTEIHCALAADPGRQAPDCN